MDAEVLQRRLQAGLAGRYAVERIVGHGGSASVFLAHDVRHRRSVALKVLHPEISAAIGAERFLGEIEIVGQLQHPHILPLYDSGESSGLLYYVMPFAADGTLRHRLEREGRLPVDEALAIARDVASALAFAHARGVIHRDIKPENVLLFSGTSVVGDFGIARVLVSATERRRTEAGMALGTPLYMSPEQASASGEIDGRSDQYSLACMVHEMLTGAPPFSGTSPVSIMARHLSEPPAAPPADLPPDVRAALQRALAKRPADRFASITDFAAALRLPPRFAPQWTARRSRLVAALGTVILLGITFVLGRGWAGGAALDPDLYAVLPFAHVGSGAPALLDGDGCAVAVREALGRWRDLRQVDQLRLNDLIIREGRRPAMLAEAMTLARSLGAGRLVWGELTAAGESVQVRAGLYDVRHGRLLRLHDVILYGDARQIASRFGQLAGALLLDPDARPADTLTLGTSVLAAWQAYAAGQAALARWSLDTAAARFAGAVAADPEYAQAHLWLAYVRWWMNAPRAAWREPARAATMLGARLLTPRDSGRAFALLALADSQFPAACAHYRGLTARDSLDPVAWYGLGECLRSDPTVVRDRASPTGWSFRTSYHEGLMALRRALAITPSFNHAFGAAVYERLGYMLMVERGRYRRGIAQAPDTGMFGAFPALVADTLAYTPRPLAEALGADRPPTLLDAITRNRAELRRLVQAWVEAFPGSAAGHAALGRVLEIDGVLGETGGGSTALAEYRRAWESGQDDATRMKGGVGAVRVLVRRGEFAAARSLADSILAAGLASADVAEALAALAALRGRVHQAARFMAAHTPAAQFDAARGPVAQPLAEQALRYAAYAGFSAPLDSLKAIGLRVQQLNRLWTERRRQDVVHAALMDQMQQLAFFAIGPTAQHRGRPASYLARMQAALARGDTADLRAQLAYWDRERGVMRGADVAVVAVFHEALLRLAIGDTAAAARELERTLASLAAVPLPLIEAPYIAAALVRAMGLEARLAARQGDTARARRWAGAVLTLWDGADAELAPVLAEARALAGL